MKTRAELLAPAPLQVVQWPREEDAQVKTVKAASPGSTSAVESSDSNPILGWVLRAVITGGLVLLAFAAPMVANIVGGATAVFFLTLWFGARQAGNRLDPAAVIYLVLGLIALLVSALSWAITLDAGANETVESMWWPILILGWSIAGGIAVIAGAAAVFRSAGALEHSILEAPGTQPSGDSLVAKGEGGNGPSRRSSAPPGSVAIQARCVRCIPY